MKSVDEVVHLVDASSLADEERRRLLSVVAGVMGGAGLVATAYPFVASLAPSELAKALGAPVTADISTIAPAELKVVAWRGKPVWLMRRTTDMVRSLEELNQVLVDPTSTRSEQPSSCANATRSQRPDFFVAVGICTHLGCSPVLRLDDRAFNAQIHAPGGFYCPCHGSRFDLAGRVAKNVPAPTNLEIPPYRFIGDSTVQIG